ncbi:MAG: hypothetical protein EKK64_06635 [Neisseriaceae bacterium]|nr:MAG: hypothetical protein EKK64_06635 [Neisseriaceae bacterium]
MYDYVQTSIAFVTMIFCIILIAGRKTKMLSPIEATKMLSPIEAAIEFEEKGCCSLEEIERLEKDKTTIKLKQFENCYATIDPKICEYVADEYHKNGAKFEDNFEMETVRDLMLSGF